LEAIDECVRKVSVEIPWDEVNDERRRLVRRVARTTTVPGFRKGKAPATVLSRYYEREILDTLKDGLVRSHLVKEIGRRDLRVAYGPMIDEMRLVEGSPLVVQARFEVFPDFELGEYRNLQVLHPLPAVTDEMVQDHLQQLRYRHGSYRNVDPRPIRDGDTVTISIEGTSGGEEPEIKMHETQVEIGHEETLADFTEALRGLSPGERTEFDVTYPTEQVAEELAGKTLRCRVEIQGITELELPELDDEFAKDVDNRFGNFEALEADVRAGMEVYTRTRALEFAQNHVVRLLAESHPMPLPNRYMEQRLREAEEHTSRSQPGGADLERLRSIEEMRVRADLVLDRIADVEDLTVSNEETEAEIRKYAQANQLTPESAHKELREKGVISAWRSQRRRAKALQFVIDEADRILLPPAQEHSHEPPEAAERAL
jgi:trigger factor